MSTFIPTNPHYGIAAIAEVGKYWGQTITTTTRYRELEAKRDALAELSTSVAGVDLAGELVATDPKTWAKSIKAAAAASVEAKVVAESVARARNIIDGQMQAELKSGDMFDHIMSQIDVEGEAERFTHAARKLGALAGNEGAAVDKGLGDELYAFREAGRRLNILTRLDCVRGRDHNLALFCDVKPLPALPFQVYSSGHRNLYSSEDVTAHNVMLAGIGDARKQEFITEVAQGKQPAFRELSPATDYDEFQRRVKIITSAGERTQVPK